MSEVVDSENWKTDRFRDVPEGAEFRFSDTDYEKDVDVKVANYRYSNYRLGRFAEWQPVEDSQ